MTRKVYFFAVTTALFLLAAPNLRAESGTCGDNVTWSMDDQGVLTIEGTGAMTDYDWNTSPFPGLRPQKVIIKGGVTTVGVYAFPDCITLASVEISGSVTSIGNCAFTGCRWITSLTLPESLTTIGAWAFNKCMGLTSITIPASVTSIGESAFKSCSGLEKIVSMPTTPPSCDEGVFYGVDNSKCVLSVPKKSIAAYKAADIWKDFTKTISTAKVVSSGTCGDNLTWTLDSDSVLTIEGTGTMPDYTYTSPAPWKDMALTEVAIGEGVTTVGMYAFEGCKGLKSVTFPSSVTSIGERAFQECTGLTSVTIGEGVTTIDIWAFVACSALESVTFPKSVTTIGDNAFLSCEKITTVTSLNPEPPALGSSTFGSLAQDATIYVPLGSVDSYKNAQYWSNFSGQIKALSSGTCGDNLTWKLDEGVLAIEGTGAMPDFTSESPAPWASISFTTAVIGEGVTTIGELAFSNCTGLTSVTIPNTVTSIGGSAFSGCTGLTSVTIPCSVTSIKEYTFSACSGLTSMDIPNSVTSIEKCAFQECKGLTSVTIPASVTGIGEWAFSNCSGLTEIVSMAQFPPYCSNNNVFYNVDKSKCVLSVPEKFLKTYKNTETWKEFTNIKAAAKKVVAEGTCGDNVKWTLDDLGELTIEGTGAIENYEIGSPAPWASLSFTTAVIGDGVTTIGELAFHKCTGLTSVTIPSSVTSIATEAFYGCTGLMEMVSQAATPPACGNNAFQGVDKYNCMLTIPEKSMEAYKAADGWKDFTNIFPAKKKIVADGSCGDNARWMLDDQGVLTIEGTGAMPGYTDDSPAPWASHSFTTAVIGEGMTTIGELAFSNCTGLTSVTIPSSVTSIENYAFEGCAGLTGVTIPSSVTSIGECAFYRCSGLTSVTIPASVTSIGNGAFSNCTGLKKIESLAVTPPTCESDAFFNVDKDECVLSVPKNSADAYKTADGWKEFTNIATGISGVAQGNSAVVSASNGEITVTGAADNAVVEVYNTSGALVYRGTGKTVTVPSAGIYVVRAAGRTFKVNTAR